jgi:hypothetical protein
MNKKNNKKKYLAPDFEAEKVFEVNAPTCGKCSTGPTSGGMCQRLRRNS